MRKPAQPPPRRQGKAHIMVSGVRSERFFNSTGDQRHLQFCRKRVQAIRDTGKILPMDMDLNAGVGAFKDFHRKNLTPMHNMLSQSFSL